MTLGRIGFALALVAVLCVLSVFFFHAIQGPYSVVHGPVTALRSSRAAAGLHTAMQSGLNSFRANAGLAISPLAIIAIVPDTNAESHFAPPVSILRC
jgi:hypothetical protein